MKCSVGIRLSSWLGCAALVIAGCDPADDGGEGADTGGETEGGGGSDEAGGDDDDDDDDDGPGEEGADDDTGGPTGQTLPLACPDEDPNPEVYEHFGSVADQTWTDGIHVVTGNFGITGTLRVEPCVTIAMEPGASLYVRSGGALQLAGEPDRRVLVSSSSEFPQPGDWGLIEFEADAVGPLNMIQHATIEYGGDADRGAMVWVDGDTEVGITGTEVRHSSSAAFGVIGGLRAFEDNVITDNESAPMYIAANRVGELGSSVYTPNGDDGIFIAEGWVREDQTWMPHDAPYIVRDAFGVGTSAGSAHLTVAAGAEIRFGTEAFLQVGEGGGLTMAGTEASPVLLRSAQPVGQAGDWDGVFFEEGSIEAFNDLDWVEIRDAGAEGHPAVLLEEGTSVAITNCNISGNGDEGVFVADAADVRDFTGNTLTNNHIGIEIVANGVRRLGPGTYGPNTNEGIFLLGDRITVDAEWNDLGVPYVAHEDFDIGGGGVTAGVRLTAGARLGLLNVSIDVDQGGWLMLDGEEGNPAVITSGGPVGGAGDWESIQFHGGSIGANNVFRYARVEYGGGGAFTGTALIHGGATLHLEHTVFADAGHACDIEHIFGTGTLDAVDSVYTLCP